MIVILIVRDGYGNETHPYVIEGLNITADSVCIDIENTNAFFEIRSCLISASSLSASNGIIFDNVTNGIIRNCTINMHEKGVYWYSSDNCTMINNTATDNDDEGFSIFYSDNCILVNNTSSNNQYNGIGFMGSSNCVVESNKITNINVGLNLISSDNCTLRDNIITGTDYGIILDNSNDCSLLENSVTGSSEFGFYLDESLNCSLTDNTFLYCGVGVVGNQAMYWLHESTGNTVNGKGFGYFQRISSSVIDGSLYGQIILVNCTGIEVEDGMFSQVSQGIQLAFCTDCTLSNNAASSNSVNGIDIYYSDFCTLVGNTANNDNYGIYLDHSDNCTLTDNTVIDAYESGINLYYSQNGTLIHNTLLDSYEGIRLGHSDHCTLMYNIAVDNGRGIALETGSQYNKIYLNRMQPFGPAVPVSITSLDNGETNSWDDGISIGNYYTDYIGTGTYPIEGSAGSIDHYPFIWDRTIPILDHPSDIEYVEGETGYKIEWSPNADNPKNYTIYQNGATIKSGFWNSSSEKISISIDGLSTGIYNYTIEVFNEAENYATDTVYVTVTSVETTTTVPPTTTDTTPTPSSNTTTNPSVIGDSPMNIVIMGAGLVMIVVIIVGLVRRQG
jgi:parallel beta-helix repeat protein